MGSAPKVSTFIIWCFSRLCKKVFVMQEIDAVHTLRAPVSRGINLIVKERQPVSIKAIDFLRLSSR